MLEGPPGNLIIEEPPFITIGPWRCPTEEELGMTEYSTFTGTVPTIVIKRGYIGKIQPGRKAGILFIEEGQGGPVPVGAKGLLAT